MSVREHLEYPELTMLQLITKNAEQYPKGVAMEFFGREMTYQSFLENVEKAARAFWNMGIKQGDAVTICMPNVPQAIISFYALNRIGAIANMVHPLSAMNEVVFYLNISKSRMIVTVDMFCKTVEEAVKKADHPVKMLVTRMQDALGLIKGTAFLLKSGKDFMKYPSPDMDAVLWKDFMNSGKASIALPEMTYDRERTAVILYSGGTSGVPKGICLTDMNFNALAYQCFEVFEETTLVGLKMLSCMPCFHGFGLGINIHTMLVFGARCILMPSFNMKSYAEMLKKKQPNIIAGVPTIFEALLHLKEMEGVSLACLHGMFCGGDSLSVELKKKVDQFLREHGATIQIREGYGLTECVTASCLTPKNTYREKSIGLPYPDTYYKIVKPGTAEVLPYGEEGEIILTGPTVMLRYLDNPDETAQTLRTLEDGKVWMYSGDLGYMDEDGYVYFKQRMKRMIITNGYNVYPGPIENIIDSVPEVAYSCVIGVKDPKRMQRVRAYVVLRDGVAGDDACRKKIMDALSEHVAKYALPKEIIFRTELPKTLVGKVAYRKLEEEAEAETDAEGSK